MVAIYDMCPKIMPYTLIQNDTLETEMKQKNSENDNLQKEVSEFIYWINHHKFIMNSAVVCFQSRGNMKKLVGA